MSIIRISHNKENPYVILNKKALEDSQLSWAAKGLWSYLMGRPDDWNVSVSHLSNIYDGRGGGEKAIYSLLNELIEKGYCHRDQKINESGQFRCISYVITEFKDLNEKHLTNDFEPDRLLRDAGKGDLTNNIYILSKDPPLTPPLEVSAKEEEDSFEKERVLVKNEKGTTNANLISQQAPTQKLCDSKNNSTTSLNKSLNKPQYILSDVNNKSTKNPTHKTNEIKNNSLQEKEYYSLLNLYQFSINQIRKLMQFTLDQIRKAIEVLSTIKVKSSTFGLLWDILCNPLNYEKKSLIDIEQEKNKIKEQTITDRRRQCEKEAIAVERHYKKNNIPWIEYKEKRICVSDNCVRIGNCVLGYLDDNFRDIYISMKKKLNLIEICKGF